MACLEIPHSHPQTSHNAAHPTSRVCSYHLQKSAKIEGSQPTVDFIKNSWHICSPPQQAAHILPSASDNSWACPGSRRI